MPEKQYHWGWVCYYVYYGSMKQWLLLSVSPDADTVICQTLRIAAKRVLGADFQNTYAKVVFDHIQDIPEIMSEQEMTDAEPTIGPVE